jgi:tetratricopeptide (TPR) repeat protein
VASTIDSRRQAAALMDVRRFEEAAGVLAGAIAHAPGDPHPRCMFAQCQLGLDDAAGALDAANGAAAADPTFEWAHRLRAVALLRLGHKREALDAALGAVRLAPDRPNGYLVLTDAELANRHLGRAQRAAERARDLAPESWEGHNAVGRVALRRRDAKRASEHFRLALQRNPESAVAMNNLGVALRAMGRRRESVYYFGEASKLDPHFSLPRRNAVKAAKAGTSVLVVAAIVVVDNLANSTASSNGLLLVATVLFIPLVVWLAVLRIRGTGHAGGQRPTTVDRSKDPKASRQLMRELRREAHTSIMGDWIRRRRSP